MSSKTHSAGLTLLPETHTVTKGAKQVRLSPVNMRVLQVLVNHAETTVSRQTLFDQIWPNQVISDDALTRAIADVRAQLKTLTNEVLIQTVPKKGYQWIYPVGEIKPQSDWLNRLKLTLGALVLAILLLMLGLRWWLKPEGVALVILPNQASITWADGSNHNINESIKSAVLKTDGLNHLSDHAYMAHKDSPYPYFSHQFGVRWFIDSQVKDNTVILTLIDARTGLVISESEVIADNGTDWHAQCLTFIEKLVMD